MKRVRFENDDGGTSPTKACYCCLKVRTGVIVCVITFIFKMMIDLAFSIDAFFFEKLFYFHPVRATSSTFFNLMGIIPLMLILLHIYGSSMKNWYAMTWLLYNAMMILANIIYIPVCDPLTFDFGHVTDIVYEVHLMLTVLFFIWSTIVAMLYYRQSRDGEIVNKKKAKPTRINNTPLKPKVEDKDTFHYAGMV